MRTIDADALAKRIQYLIRLRTYDAFDCLNEIDAAPTIDAVSVVHGQWLLNSDGSGTCNQCHMTQKNVWDYDHHQNFCGCCGAKMDLEETY